MNTTGQEIPDSTSNYTVAMDRHPTDADVGAVIRAERERCGMTQKEVADAIGLHRPSVSKIETGERKVTALEAGELAKLFGVGVGHICCPPTIDFTYD